MNIWKQLSTQSVCDVFGKQLEGGGKMTENLEEYLDNTVPWHGVLNPKQIAKVS